MTRLYYHRLSNQLTDSLCAQLLEKIPPNLRASMRKSVKWQNEQTSVLGKFLLTHAFHELNIAPLLHKVKASNTGRLYVDNEIDFNISHSNECTVCIVTDEARAGIDIEQHVDIELMNFKRLFESEWTTIMQAADKYKSFFDFWTKKEAIAKADGRGLFFDFSNIQLDGDIGLMDGLVYHLYSCQLYPDYTINIASTNRLSYLSIHEINIGY